MAMVPNQLRRNWVLVAMLGGPSALLLLRRSPLAHDHTRFSSLAYVVVVGAIAIAAASLALAIAVAAKRSKRGGPLLLAAGCMAVGIIMVGQGVLTVVVGDAPDSLWADRLTWLAVGIYAVMFAVASGHNGRATRWAAGHSRLLFGGTALMLVLPIGAVVAEPQQFAPTVYGWEGEARTFAAAVVVTLLISAALVHFRRWRLGGEVISLALAGSAAMTIAATFSLWLGERWQLAWWDSNGFVLLGFLGVIFAALAGSGGPQGVIEAIDDVFADDPLVHISAGYPEALQALVHALEVKDVYSYGHSRRLAELSVRLGGRLHLDVDQLRTLGRGSFLHDIGKIGISSEILNKPGALTADERRTIERHTEFGAELVRSAPSLADTIDVILYHHERWDGSGYPEGLAGRDIPLLARICAVTDVWDALTSDRAYRPGWPPEQALAYLSSNAGVLFDASVVDAMLDFAHTDLGYDLPPAPAVANDSGELASSIAS